MSKPNGKPEPNGKAEALYPFLDKVVHAKKRAFLVAYCDCFSISEAAQRVGIGRQSHYYWSGNDPDYAEAFRRAKEIAAETLESELTRRALHGNRRYKFHQGRPIMVPCAADHPEAVELENGKWARCYYEVEYADTLGIFLMKGAMPEKYRERYEYRESDSELDQAIDRELALLKRSGD